jgi:hypothetical protein
MNEQLNYFSGGPDSSTMTDMSHQYHEQLSDLAERVITTTLFDGLSAQLYHQITLLLQEELAA